MNSQGFAEEIHQTITESSGYTYSNTKTCKYDSEGHLIFMKDSRENREYTITWEDGNIIKVQQNVSLTMITNWNGKDFTTSITILLPIVNTCCSTMTFIV